MGEKQDMGASADADRATHEQSQQAVSALRVGIASAEDEWSHVGEGYEAWERGEPFDKFQYERWQEGWFVGFHGAEWEALAKTMGARCSGFSYDRAATFVWPSGFVCEIAGDLNRHLRCVHAQAIETRRATTAGRGAKHESAVLAEDAPKDPQP